MITSKGRMNERGPWIGKTILGAYVQYRRRIAEADETENAIYATMVEISVNGSRPHRFADFDVTDTSVLEIAVSQLLASAPSFIE